MAFKKVRRQRRYEILRNSGFMGFEARELSKSPLKLPYFDILIKERAERFALARHEGWTKERYQRSILEEYGKNGWISRAKSGRMAAKSAWNMFRHYEEIYRRKLPGYTSPWERRRKAFKDFVSKHEKKVRQDYGEMMRVLDQKISVSSGEHRERLLQQKKNLETWMEKEH